MTDELFREDSYLKECAATVTRAADGAVCLDRTVFYPMGGGQPGDSGVLKLADGGAVRIADTRKDKDTGDILHILAEGETAPAEGAAVTVVLDWDRRHRHMRMHSCLHLLCSLVPGAVTGGNVSDAKGRLDFDLEESPDKAELTEKLNALIAADAPVAHSWIADEELEANPEMVRTMSVKPPMGQGRVRIISVQGVDTQPCGGTHVARTGEIGPVEVAKIEKKGRMNRRISVAFMSG
ncbi:Ser-tRNA(Ala) deacylase [Caenispirillum salinarum AK4]|uniref:Alanine--tRNA ligase n=1 Tax=Caenispirillum salinarum AK4 TaxID=1238182 RepID=K9HLY8_9PROT|nr:alanyl-tRNA editing protein [Caenispirillum salinarum]EKV31368.1 Ser-tRNA(Ala) deacylase [Caenispirillum salinarum AK4]